MKDPATLVALLHGPDQPGLVAKTSGWIYARQGNILHADQHRDMEAGEFFQRIEWVPAGHDAAAAVAEFSAFAAELGMAARVARSDHRPKGALFISKEDHCFHDLALRWKAGEFAGDFAAVISNHLDLAAAAKHYGLPFYHVPVSAVTKVEAERRQVEILREIGAEFVVLARYMHVLSADFLRLVQGNNLPKRLEAVQLLAWQEVQQAVADLFPLRSRSHVLLISPYVVREGVRNDTDSLLQG